MDVINANMDTAQQFIFTEENGVEINVNAFDKVVAVLCNRKNGAILQKYSTAPIVGEKQIFAVDMVTFRLWFESAMWVNHVDGDLFLEVIGYQINAEVTGGFSKVGAIIELPKLERNV